MFNFENLDEKTRGFMLKAIAEAEQSNNIYHSTRFNDDGYAQWLPLLKEAAQEHDEHWLAYQLETHCLMKGLEGSMTPSGGYTIKHVPHTAAATMAEGQFNRFYILGLCKRARGRHISTGNIPGERKFRPATGIGKFNRLQVFDRLCRSATAKNI